MYIYKHEYLCWPTANGAPQEDLVLVLECRDKTFADPLYLLMHTKSWMVRQLVSPHKDP